MYRGVISIAYLSTEIVDVGWAWVGCHGKNCLTSLLNAAGFVPAGVQCSEWVQRWLVAPRWPRKEGAVLPARDAAVLGHAGCTILVYGVVLCMCLRSRP